jgi:hypothetical protein
MENVQNSSEKKKKKFEKLVCRIAINIGLFLLLHLKANLFKFLIFSFLFLPECEVVFGIA